MKPGIKLVGLAIVFAFRLLLPVAVLPAADSTVAVGELAPDAIRCPAKIEWEIRPGVRLLTFSCDVSEATASPHLTYRVRLQNIDHRPHRYRVQIETLGAKPLVLNIPEDPRQPPLGTGQSAAADYLAPNRNRPPEVMSIRITASP